MLDIAIIGAGLSGLSLAQYVSQAGLSFAIFEARSRVGGRILSVPGNANGSPLDYRYDLGPSWVWPEFQPRIARFIEENDLEVYSQWNRGKALYKTDRETAAQAYVDHTTYEPARRIQGGASRLVETFLKTLPEETLKLSHRLSKVINQNHHVELQFTADSAPLNVKAKQVVITIPPRLLINTVSFMPALDSRLRDLMNNTATWMAGHAKAVIRYTSAFWRETGYSGSALVNYPGAALAEIFDACSPAGDQAALCGFFALPAPLRSKYSDDLNALIVEQLVRLFGKEAAHPEGIIIKDWFNEPLTATQADEYPPSAHPQYGHAWLQLDHWNGKLFFSGTETASQFGGYLEGALESTERVVKSVLA